MTNPPVPEQLRLYRERHTITVRTVESGRHQSYFCQHDGIQLYRIFGGWRHDHDQIRALARQA